MRESGEGGKERGREGKERERQCVCVCVQLTQKTGFSILTCVDLCCINTHLTEHTVSELYMPLDLLLSPVYRQWEKVEHHMVQTDLQATVSQQS